ncbi:MAG: DUF6531 domain-containing protein, partial [Candidatus Accumulibacter sp.]|nr:DUF6531 domain-containing protein [Accumulibacter sp.]
MGALLLSGAAWASTCTKTNFIIGFEIAALEGPLSDGRYQFFLSPVRCSASGQVVYDPGIGFSDPYELGWFYPHEILPLFRNPYMSHRAFEGTCKFSYLGVINNYNGYIDSIYLSTSAYPASQTPYIGEFPGPLHLTLNATAQGVKKDGVPDSSNSCGLPIQRKDPSPGPDDPSDDTSDDIPKKDPPKKDDPCFKNPVQTGNPILPGRGCKVQREYDYAASGNSLLSVVRYYDSQDPYHIKSSGPRLVGNRWRLNLEAKLNADIVANKVLMLRGDGTILHFVPKTGSTTEWVGDADVNATLVKSGTTWTYQTASGVVETFDNLGRRTTRVLPDARSLTTTYDTAGKLATVADHTGRTLTLAYNANGLVTGITDGTNTLVAYTYDTESNLTSAAYPDGTTRQYSYTSKTVGSKVEPALLTGITDENGVL